MRAIDYIDVLQPVKRSPSVNSKLIEELTAIAQQYDIAFILPTVAITPTRTTYIRQPEDGALPTVDQPLAGDSCDQERTAVASASPLPALAAQAILESSQTAWADGPRSAPAGPEMTLQGCSQDRCPAPTGFPNLSEVGKDEIGQGWARWDDGGLVGIAPESPRG